MRYVSIIICILALFTGGCSSNSKTTDIKATQTKQSVIQISEAEQEEAKKTVIDYIKALNDNNYDEYLRHLSTSRVRYAEQNRIRHNSMPKYEYARIVNITPDDSEESRDGYLNHGRGKRTKPSKLAIFKVDLEYKLSPNGIDENTDEKVEWTYFLVKEKETDDWKVDDFGV